MSLLFSKKKNKEERKERKEKKRKEEIKKEKMKCSFEKIIKFNEGAEGKINKDLKLF